MKKLGKGYIVFSLILALGAGSATAQKKLTDKEKDAYSQALKFAEKTNNRASVDILRKLYDKHPDNIDIAYNLGICYINMSGNADSALFFLRRVR